jgi:hypothetical protein
MSRGGTMQMSINFIDDLCFFASGKSSQIAAATHTELNSIDFILDMLIFFY